eukprot:11182762-Prorocentrum_lima.AAC.1
MWPKLQVAMWPSLRAAMWPASQPASPVVATDSSLASLQLLVVLDPEEWQARGSSWVNPVAKRSLGP